MLKSTHMSTIIGVCTFSLKNSYSHDIVNIPAFERRMYAY